MFCVTLLIERSLKHATHHFMGALEWTHWPFSINMGLSTWMDIRRQVSEANVLLSLADLSSIGPLHTHSPPGVWHKWRGSDYRLYIDSNQIFHSLAKSHQPHINLISNVKKGTYQSSNGCGESVHSLDNTRLDTVEQSGSKRKTFKVQTLERMKWEYLLGQWV